MDDNPGEKFLEKSDEPSSRPSAERESPSHQPADYGKTPIAQAPLPVQPPLPSDRTTPLQKLDSNVVDVKGHEETDPFGHLPENERAILKRQLDEPEVKVGFFTLYRYASKLDILILVVSTVATIAAGAAMPLMTVVFGNLTGLFSDYFNGHETYHQFLNKLTHFVLYFVYLAVGEFFSTYIYTVGFIYVGEHATQKIREKYLAAMLRQNIAYFDQLGAGEVTTRITADTNLIQDGVSEKVGLAINAIATFIAAFVIAYVKFWKLALILTSTIVAITLTMGTVSTFIVKYSTRTQEEYAKGGTVAEEVLSSIRNATAFNTQNKLARQYDGHLIVAEHWGRKLQFVMGSMFAVIMFFVYCNYGLACWEGSKFLVDGQVSVGPILTIFFAIVIGAFSLGNAAPHAKAISTAVGAGHKIFAAIDRSSPIDPTSQCGRKVESVDGTIELRHIKHIYPSRPEVTVMDDVNLVVPAGKQTALVGASGSGKSTIVGLVERFYDPVGGEVLLDGVNIQELNLRQLRQHMSLVQQEPILFATTIYDNIRYGLLGTSQENLPNGKVAELVENAARMANAHDFIAALPEGYETHVGERGFLLSGGQKQRVAIARAIVSDPKILLLDEATSALDTKSEGVVQAALDKAAQGRTTIVIAHRLSTIKNADNIVVMQTGKIVEQGRHGELLDKRGAYFALVEAQRIASEQKEKEVEGEEAESVLGEQPSGSGGSPSGQDIEKPALSCPTDPDDVHPNIYRTQTGQSASSAAIKLRKPEVEQEYSLRQLFALVWSFNRKEWYLMAVGFCFSVIAGAGFPVHSIFLAKVIAVLSLPPPQYGELRHDINFWAGMYLMLAFVMLIANSGHGWAFGYCSERLVHRTRDQAFRAMLRQDITFFDKDENNVGALTSFLSTQTTHLAGLSGSTLGTLLMVFTTLVTACALSLAVGWKLSLVCMTTIPVLLACGFLRFWMLTRFQRRAKKAYESSAGFACEATSAIRTVASLTREDDIQEKYHQQLDAQKRASLNSVLKSSLLFASSQSFIFLCVALGFWYGGTLIAKHEYSLFHFFVCFTSIIFGSQSAGTIFSFAPDMGKAKLAATELKRLFDRKPSIDPWSQEGETVPDMEGHIEFRDVHFRYPTRPEQPVLRGLNLTIKPGQYVALVGASGCGKSTTIALVERFYDPLVGGIYADGREISQLNLNDYRSYLALVSQEPTLYQGTIRDNVLLGADRDDVPDSEIEKACRDANIYDFVTSLPDGFNTICGSKGTLLSGGQKQRIAIARALLRNPKILLLDEATSALDSESEKVVQAALDTAAKGRTTIAVAHRLSTIQKADVIYVIDGGRVAEQGTHNELLAKKGRYAELVTMQSLEKTA